MLFFVYNPPDTPNFDIPRDAYHPQIIQSIYTGNFWEDLRLNWFEQCVIIEAKKEIFNPREIRYQQKDSLKRYLASGRMELYLEDPENLLMKGEPQGPILHFWKKGINIPRPKKFPKIGVNYRSPNFPTDIQRHIMENIKNFPVFVVRNGLKEMVLAYPQHFYRRTWVDRLYNLYFKHFLWKYDRSPYALGFFFFNPEDVKDLTGSMSFRYPRSVKELKIEIYPASLHFAYKLNRTSHPNLQFKFVPDLKEILRLLKIYKYQKRFRFHPKQIYGRSYFQGQPIYMIQNKLKNQQSKEKLIFTSIDGVDRGWELIKKENPTLSLPDKPQLLVYNLESFLKDYETLNKPTPFRLITNSDSYDFIQNLNSKPRSRWSTYYSRNVKRKVFFWQLWIKRLVWAITRLHPPSAQ